MRNLWTLMLDGLLFAITRWYILIMKQLWWIPNALTIIRGFYLAPAIAIIFVWEWCAASPIAAHLMQSLSDFVLLTLPPHPNLTFNYLMWAFWFTVIGVVSDFIDGVLARKFKGYGWQTPLGKYLDPYADKFLGLSVLFSIPLHYGVGWYLIIYLPVGRYIIWYSRTTTQMRKDGKITGASTIAQWKTALQMGVKLVYMFDIAWASTLTEIERSWLQSVALSGFAVSAFMCYWSLRDYIAKAPKHHLRAALAK